MFKVDNENTRKRLETRQKLVTKTIKLHHLYNTVFFLTNPIKLNECGCNRYDLLWSFYDSSSLFNNITLIIIFNCEN